MEGPSVRDSIGEAANEDEDEHSRDDADPPAIQSEPLARLAEPDLPITITRVGRSVRPTPKFASAMLTLRGASAAPRGTHESPRARFDLYISIGKPAMAQAHASTHAS